MSPDALHNPVVIVGAARTPMGAFQGSLAGHAAPELGAAALSAAVQRAGLPPEHLDEVFMGCVLQAGLGQAPARQAALLAGLPWATACTTVNKVCGSGMKAVMLAHDALLAGSAKAIAAGGMENMSRAPHLVRGLRDGLSPGAQPLLDHLFFDGLQEACDPPTRGHLMGRFAEDCATACGFDRAAQDAFALHSTLRAQAAQKAGHFEWECCEVPDSRLHADEVPAQARPERIPHLPPAFTEHGTVTAANASAIADGAAALILTRLAFARANGLVPLARICGHARHAQAPALFTTAPAGAVRSLLDRLGWSVDDVDLWEINEAFAVVALAAMQTLGIPPERLNVHGGACALGHPIGATGARLIVTLLGALRQGGGRRGVASLCIGGGEATAIAIERL
jgi:acetyl-CoA C-acetyltransferase